MAKTRTTVSEKSVEECSIEVGGKVSFEMCVKTNNVDYQDDGTHAILNIDATSTVTEDTIHHTTETSINNISGIGEESSLVIDDSDSSKFLEIQNPREKEMGDETGDESGDENKSDYGAESFYSDDSCKRSEVTNVTSRSSLSGSSSLLHSSELKYDKRITDLIRSRRSGDRRRQAERDNKEGLSFSENELNYLSEEDGALTADRRLLTRSGRRNMSFTNEELKKIERENQLLLKKIMSHQKPQNKLVKPVSGTLRPSSSAINRKRQQKKIDEDNMILLRRIQQAKPCAMPRASAPGCKLATM